MQNIKNAQQGKADKTLNKLVRYEEGVMTRREWINLMRVKGARVEESTKNRIQFDRLKYNRMKGGIWSNEQREYEKKCEEIVVCYELHPPNTTSFWEITKTEYDYFNMMELSEDINTEKMDISNRIQAGIATDEEVEDDMQKEFDFMNKYFSPLK